MKTSMTAFTVGLFHGHTLPDAHAARLWHHVPDHPGLHIIFLARRRRTRNSTGPSNRRRLRTGLVFWFEKQKKEKQAGV